MDVVILIIVFGLANLFWKDPVGDREYWTQRFRWRKRRWRRDLPRRWFAEVPSAWVRCFTDEHRERLNRRDVMQGFGALGLSPPKGERGEWEGLLPAEAVQRAIHAYRIDKGDQPCEVIMEGAPPFRLLAGRDGHFLRDHRNGKIANYARERNMEIAAKHRADHPRPPGGWGRP